MNREACKRCGDPFLVTQEPSTVLCGCGLKFRVCENCYSVWTGCSDRCRSVHRKEMAHAMEDPLPTYRRPTPVFGPDDFRTHQGDLFRG